MTSYSPPQLVFYPVACGFLFGMIKMKDVKAWLSQQAKAERERMEIERRRGTYGMGGQTRN